MLSRGNRAAATWSVEILIKNGDEPHRRVDKIKQKP